MPDVVEDNTLFEEQILNLKTDRSKKSLKTSILEKNLTNKTQKSLS
jgi:hypothetical protein